MTPVPFKTIIYKYAHLFMLAVLLMLALLLSRAFSTLSSTP
jgi:hypothetical protein